MKRWSLLFLLLGLGVITFMVMREGAGEVWKVLAVGGWALLWLVPFQLIPKFFDALAWQLLLQPYDPERKTNLPYYIWVCSVREAVGRLLPLSSLAGDVVGVHLVRQRLPTGPVIATTITEIFMTLSNQYLFSLMGIALLVTLTGTVGATSTILWSLLLSLPIPILFGLSLHYGSMFRRIESFMERTLGAEVAKLVDGRILDREIRAVFQRWGRFLHSMAWQFVSFMAGAVETWLALYLLGKPISFGAALAIESIIMAIRNLVFFVPGGVGVQEAGILLFGSMLGLDNSTALSLSLAKRMRELVYGVPVLLTWQWQEARRLRQSLRAKSSV